MTTMYHSEIGKSIKSAAPRQSAAQSPLRFSSFAGRRHFPPVPVARQIRPAERVYVAMPIAFYDCPVADEAIMLVARHAETVIDPRGLFLDNADWRRRCGSILRRCDATFCLLTPDHELSAGCYAEVAYAHVLGFPYTSSRGGSAASRR